MCVSVQGAGSSAAPLKVAPWLCRKGLKLGSSMAMRCNHACLRRALAVVPLMAVAAVMQQGGIVPWTRPSAGPSEGMLAVEPIIKVRKARIVG